MTEHSADSKYDIVIVGGGIAGVTCVETIAGLCEDLRILLITASPVVKAVSNFVRMSDIRETFDVEERPSSYLEQQYPNVCLLHDLVTGIEAVNHCINTKSASKIYYSKLCLCSGGKPKLISDNKFVIGIRDTESVMDLQKRLSGCRKVAVVGNGGIATEFVYKVQDVDIVWCVKDESISAAFVDAGAAEFFLPMVSDQDAAEASSADAQPRKRLKFTESSVGSEKDLNALGEALGPDWHENVKLQGMGQTRNVSIEYSVSVKEILNPDQCRAQELNVDIENWPVFLKLTNDKVFGCDLVISATGVTPNTDVLGLEHDFTLAEDGGIVVDDKLKTSVKDVYAAGDVCSVGWEPAKHWHQMRLWTQARQMGFYAAKSIHADLNDEELLMDICFDLFAHTTRFFGYKVILLGLFNAQKLGSDHELLLRVTKGQEYVKVVLQNGKMQGAILIGETDLEETFEHLILDEIDLSRYGEDLLDPNIDIEDYFD